MAIFSSNKPGRVGGAWRIAAVVLFLICGGQYLMIISHINSGHAAPHVSLDASLQKPWRTLSTSQREGNPGTINFAEPALDPSKDLWLEPVRATAPRVLVVHNVATPAECEHLMNLGRQKGLSKALILPYGESELVESSTRTNTAAWLEFGQDDVVRRVEERLALATGTLPDQGENLQILRYKPGQKFEPHQDFFDPKTDPPENFEPGGNRAITAVLYLRTPEEGGETHFTRAQDQDLRLKARPGDAVLFYNVKPNGDVDYKAWHEGVPPVSGEKWVATKWIHERKYQVGQDATQEEWTARQPGNDDSSAEASDPYVG